MRVIVQRDKARDAVARYVEAEILGPASGLRVASVKQANECFDCGSADQGDYVVELGEAELQPDDRAKLQAERTRITLALARKPAPPQAT